MIRNNNSIKNIKKVEIDAIIIQCRMVMMVGMGFGRYIWSNVI